MSTKNLRICEIYSFTITDQKNSLQIRIKNRFTLENHLIECTGVSEIKVACFYWLTLTSVCTRVIMQLLTSMSQTEMQ